jgi:hypothetical protein
MDKDLEKIKKLPPEQRIKALQEMEKKNKEEIEKIQRSIEESIDQVKKNDEIEEELQDIIPKQKEVDITELFNEEDESDIEKQAKDAPKGEDKNLEEGVNYWNGKSIGDINERVAYLNQVVEGQGQLNYQQQQEAQAIGYALKNKEEQYANTGVTGSEQLENQVYTTRKLLEQTMGSEQVKYQRKGGFI